MAIRIPPAPVFLATKWEAFANRGRGDLLASHDLEDVITVVAGRPEIVGEVRASRPDLRLYLASRIEAFLQQDMAPYAVQGALPDSALVPELVPQTIGRLHDLATYP